jgi:hypothetical protein
VRAPRPGADPARVAGPERLRSVQPVGACPHPERPPAGIIIERLSGLTVVKAHAVRREVARLGLGEAGRP